MLVNLSRLIMSLIQKYEDKYKLIYIKGIRQINVGDLLNKHRYLLNYKYLSLMKEPGRE